MIALEDLKRLNDAQWEKAIKQARQLFIDSLPEPKFDDYARSGISDYPAWLNKALVIGLVALALFALWVSAGKQLAAGDLVFSDLTSVTSRVSGLWVSGTLVFLVLSGEIGALVFSLFAGITLQRRARVVFRAFSFVSAAIALVANCSVTALRPMPDVAVYQWLVTIAMPCLVLGIGFAGEHMLLSYLKGRVDAKREYEEAYGEWKTIRLEPENDPKYRRYLVRSVINAVVAVQPSAMRGDIEAWFEANRDARIIAFQAEWNRHEYQVSIETLRAQDIQIEAVPSVFLSSGNTQRNTSETSGNNIPVSSAPKEPPPAVKKAMEWIADHPESDGLTVREAAEQSGIALATMQRARAWNK